MNSGKPCYLILILFLLVSSIPTAWAEGLFAGAAATNIDPPKMPVIQNGGFAQRITNTIVQSLYARSLVLKNGETRIAICVVDSCMLPRELCDEAKALVEKQTGIPQDRILISATHTHTAPSAMRALGTPADPWYPQFLVPKIAESIAAANENLQPAEAGWTVADADDFTNTRRWIFLPHKMQTDPYGKVTVRAMMHPGHANPNTAGPSGPEDPDLTLLSLRTRDGKPLAVLGNLSQHYYAVGTLSSGFTGTFCKLLEEEYGDGFVGIMSQGTSGDLQWRDYSKPRGEGFLGTEKDHYTAWNRALADLAIDALKKVEYQSDCELAMEEKKLPLQRRKPDQQRIDWAKPIVEALGENLPKRRHEVLAKEVFWILENPDQEVKLQTIRVGDFGIATLPNEVYGITGLKLKAQSPLHPLMVVELANGASGYIPPPEQHQLGGYTTWAARTAGLEVQAEPKMVESLLTSLENLSGEKRRIAGDSSDANSEKIGSLKPSVFWRMDSHSGDRIGDAVLEPGYALYLPGRGEKGRSVHFAGGRMRADKPVLHKGTNYSVSLWFWNAMPHDARPVTGYFFSLGNDGDSMIGDHLGISGKSTQPSGRLLFYNGNRDKTAVVGTTELKRQAWHHILLVREGEKIRVYLDGRSEPEIDAIVRDTRSEKQTAVFVGGRADKMFSFEGKIDDVAVFNSVVKPEDNPVLAVEGYPVAKAKMHPEVPPVPADKATERIFLTDGFVAEQVAAEPLTMDPVAIDWDDKGRLWIVEMADYPLGINNDPKQPAGRVRILTDTDADGIYDKSSLFLDKLNFPNGLMTWRDGVIITAAPDILFARDIDGDGKADETKVLYTDLPEGNQQLRINGPRLGLDGWIYLANGWRSQGIVKSAISDHQVEVRGRDLRIRPATGEIEAVSGPTQFGRVRNDAGDWFGCMNARPIYHYALADRYLRRNPHTPFPQPYIELYDDDSKSVFPAKPPEKRYHNFHQSGRFTSACGPGFYRDNVLFDRENDHYFICEPFHNLVHHSVVSRKGFTYTGGRDETEKSSEFFASDDRWCRPVMARTGPDGALWVVDMYRYIIEHPQFLPPHGKAELEPYYRLGNKFGRIYRIFPKGKRPEPWTGGEPMAMMNSSNGIQRDLAHRILADQNASRDVAKLRKLAADGSAPDLTRLHALHLLREKEALTAHDLKRHIGSRNVALQKAVPELAESLPAVQRTIGGELILLENADEKVAFQLALTLGETEGQFAWNALVRLLEKHRADPYWRAALFSSVNGKNLDFVLSKISQNPSVVGELCRLAFQMKNEAASKRALSIVMGDADKAYRFQVLGSIYSELSESQRQEVKSLNDEAPGIALDSTAPILLRTAAIGLLGSDHVETLISLLGEHHPPTVRESAARGVAKINRNDVADRLLAAWPGLDTAIRDRVVGILLSRPVWAAAMLKAMEQKAVDPAILDAADREQFARVLPKEQKPRLANLLGNVASESERAEIIENYAASLKKPGDSEKGRALFSQQCVACHKLEGVGINLGPDLYTLTERSRESLLDSILDPGSNVDPRYRLYIATATDGRVISGFLDAQSDSYVTIRQADNRTVRIPRNELKQLQRTRLSLMPTGLEAVINVDAMADLFAYLEEVFSKQGR